MIPLLNGGQAVYNKVRDVAKTRYYRRHTSEHQSVICLTNQLNFFELMRRIERSEHALEGGSYYDLFKCVRIIQPADLSFAARELVDVKKNSDPLNKQSKFIITTRHFGMFAPYGPLPIHITDHARQELMVYGSRVFQEFISIFSQRFAVLQYRAWSQLHVLLGHERGNSNSFLKHVKQLSGVSELDDKCHESHNLRPLFAGAWLTNRLNLLQLGKILSHYFQVKIVVSPRYARWFEYHKKNTQQRMGFLGKTRIGKRFFDAQNSAKISIGPLGKDEYISFLHDGERFISLMKICSDFVSHQLVFSVDIIIKMEPEMSGRVSKVSLGKNSWLKISNKNHIKNIC